MHTNELALAYRELLLVVERYYSMRPVSNATQDESDWKVVHIALSDELIERAVEVIEMGEPAVLNNRSAQDTAIIQSIVNASTPAERIKKLRHRSQSLIARLAQLDDALWLQSVRLLVHDRDLHLVADQEMIWKDLIELRAATHIPAHTNQFKAWIDQLNSTSL